MSDIRIGIIGGSGLGDVLRASMDPQDARTHDVDTPFGSPSSVIVTGTANGTPIAILERHGPGHVLSPAQVPFRANIYALKMLGCTHIVASGATGSLREEIVPGDLVICDQLIDRTDGRDRTFFEHAAVHVEFADPFCPLMRRWLLDAGHGLSGGVAGMHERGTYICMAGPSFSTKAESHLYRQWGADVVGMTALPEARLAREAEMAYALIALPTDYDCWRRTDDADHAHHAQQVAGDHASLLEEIIANLTRASQASIALINAALADTAPLRERPSPAHDALRLAIWTRKEAIDAEEVERLRPLWGRYFEEAKLGS